MKLSKTLSLKEMLKSRTASRLGISNSPTVEHIENMMELALNIFQPIRNYFDIPIYISSGYRSEALNTAIGGSKTSQHSKGEAIDIDRNGSNEPTNAQIFDYIKNTLEFDQLIWEFGTDKNPNWVHVSYVNEEANRNRCLLAFKDENNKTKYAKEFSSRLVSYHSYWHSMGFFLSFHQNFCPRSGTYNIGLFKALNCFINLNSFFHYKKKFG